LTNLYGASIEIVGGGIDKADAAYDVTSVVVLSGRIDETRDLLKTKKETKIHFFVAGPPRRDRVSFDDARTTTTGVRRWYAVSSLDRFVARPKQHFLPSYRFSFFLLFSGATRFGRRTDAYVESTRGRRNFYIRLYGSLLRFFYNRACTRTHGVRTEGGRGEKTYTHAVFFSGSNTRTLRTKKQTGFSCATRKRRMCTR